VIRESIKEHVPTGARAAEFRVRNRRPDRWKNAKQLETRVEGDDALLSFLKKHPVMRLAAQDQAVIEPSMWI
jgi:hypothetical protein